MAPHLHRYLMQLRRTGAKGTLIPVHHSFSTLAFSPRIIASLTLLPLACLLLLWLGTPLIISFWGDIFSTWLKLAELPASVSYAQINLLGEPMAFPYPTLIAAAPTESGIIITGIACIALLFGSFFLPAAFLPISYLLRAGAVIQFSAVIFFWFWPGTFPYQIGDYIAGCMAMSMHMLFLVPIVLALTFFIFDLSFAKKCWLAIVTLGYFIVVVPFQYMLHAYILYHFSLLPMGLLYLLFGLLLDIMMFVGFYAWGMSWRQAK